jgi:sulfide dehydrogenase cytochrome subunit
MTFVHLLRPRLAMLASALAFLGTAASGQTASDLHIRALAATCANCHGTDGAAAQGQAMVRLAGLPKDYIVAQMIAFREGKRPATVMHQISKGYSPEQINTLATYFAAKP